MLAAESTAYIGYLYVAEQTGEVLNDAIFSSNRAVEGQLNIVIKQTPEGVCANFVLSCCALSPDGKTLAIGSADRLYCVYICKMEE